MVALGEQCSMTERRADDATREVDAWLKCEFLKDRIDEEFGGVIAAVTNFGVFVELNDLYIEGLMHVSALPGDYYHFDQVKQRLIGERTRQVFQLGGAVTVRVARVDLDDRKIDLELAGSPPSKGKGSRRSADSGNKGGSKRGKTEARRDAKGRAGKGAQDSSKASRGSKSAKPSKARKSTKSGKAPSAKRGPARTNKR
jgi:ribonuclease R